MKTILGEVQKKRGQRMEVSGGEVGLQLNNKPIDFEVRRGLEKAESYSSPWNICTCVQNRVSQPNAFLQSPGYYPVKKG